MVGFGEQETFLCSDTAGNDLCRFQEETWPHLQRRMSAQRSDRVTLLSMKEESADIGTVSSHQSQARKKVPQPRQAQLGGAIPHRNRGGLQPAKRQLTRCPDKNRRSRRPLPGQSGLPLMSHAGQ